MAYHYLDMNELHDIRIATIATASFASMFRNTFAGRQALYGTPSEQILVYTGTDGSSCNSTDIVAVMDKLGHMGKNCDVPVVCFRTKSGSHYCIANPTMKLRDSLRGLIESHHASVLSVDEFIAGATREAR